MKRLLLFIIPLFTLIVSVAFIKQLSPFYMSVPDPTYIHLFSGINLAGGYMEVGNTDNPGTTVQCFAAIVIYVCHLFSGSGLPLYQDVLLHPENYLMACSIVLIILFVTVNYLSGAYVFRHTGNVGLSMAFQVIPFINMNIIQRAIVLEPEAMIITASTFFMAYLFIKAYEYETNNEKSFTTREIIIMALFTGFLIASKYTCAPITILVLFMLHRKRERFAYLGMIFISFFIFIIPAIPKLKNMYQWVWNLFTHDGIYGKGEARIIDPGQYFGKLKGIFLTDTIFTVLYSLITLSLLVAIIMRISKRTHVPYFSAIAGIWCFITSLIMIVAKHCDFHYLIPAECCFPLGMVVSYRILSDCMLKGIAFYKKHKRIIIYPVAIMFLIFMLVEKIRYLPIRHPQPVLTDKYTIGYEKEPLLIAIKSSTECERIELSLYLGYLFSGSMRETYAGFLSRIYPDSYIFWDGSGVILHWGKEMSLSDFAKGNNKMLVYMKGFNDSIRVSFMSKLCNCNGNKPGDGFRTEETFRDNPTMQIVYSIEHL